MRRKVIELTVETFAGIDNDVLRDMMEANSRAFMSATTTTRQSIQIAGMNEVIMEALEANLNK